MKIVRYKGSGSEWYLSLGSVTCFLLSFIGGLGRLVGVNCVTHMSGVEWLSLPPGLLGSLVHRVQTQCSQISHWFKSVTGSTDSFQESLNTLKRDELNLRKLLVVATSSGKVKIFLGS